MTVQAGSQNLTFGAQGQVSEGQPITLTGTLQSQWTNPFGLKWISISSGTFTVTIGNPTQITLQGNGVLTFSPGSDVTIGLSIGMQGFVFSFTGVPVADLPAFYQAVSGKAAPSQLNAVSVKGTAGLVKLIKKKSE